MRCIIITILFLSTIICNAQVIARRALENNAAIPPGGNPTPPVLSYVFALSDGITLSWTASTDADGIRAYLLYVNGTFNIAIPPTFLKYTIDGLAQNTTYNLTAKAIDNIGNLSNVSNTITHRTLILHGPQTFNSNQNVYDEFLNGTVAAPVIDGYEFAGPAASQNGNVLRFFGTSAMTIRNCVIRNSTGGSVSGCRGIYIDGGINQTIRNNLFWNTRGGMLISSTTGGTTIEDNQFINMPGPYSAGQFISFTPNNTGAGNVIQNNRGINWYGESIAEDMISINGSSGTSGSKTLVQSNYLQGDGPSMSGGGIVCGEAGGSNIRIQNNRLLQPGNYAVAITGGDGNELLNNWSYQDRKPWSNNGVLAYGGGCSNVIVTGNRAHAICGQTISCAGQPGTPFCPSPGASNNCYIPSDCSGTKQACPVPEMDLDTLAFPTPQELITFLGEDKYWKFRENKDFMDHIITFALSQDCVPRANIERPNAVVMANFSTGSTSTTLTNTSNPLPAGVNTIASYLWSQVSGPTTATIVSPTSSSTSVTGLTQAGQYIFRLVISQNNYPSQASLGVITYDSDRVIVTKT